MADLGGFAEQYVWTDPMGSLTKMRLFAEQMVKSIYTSSTTTCSTPSFSAPSKGSCKNDEL
jgi:hypothetical protein